MQTNEFSHLAINDILVFHNSDFGFEREYTVKVTKINKYNSFSDYLQAEGLANCLPGIDSIEEGLQVYYKYFTKEDEQLHKILAIKFSDWKYKINLAFILQRFFSLLKHAFPEKKIY